MVTPICEEPLCGIICIFFFLLSPLPSLLRHRLHFAPVNYSSADEGCAV